MISLEQLSQLFEVKVILVAAQLVQVTPAAVELVQALQMFSIILGKNMEEHARLQKSQRAYLN